jgi:hypothetical protein
VVAASAFASRSRDGYGESDPFETTPFLNATSPEKQCGKTRLLDALELVVARPWRTIMPSEAVLFRKIDAASPTLLLDECDAIFDTNGSTEPLRALLNAGNRRGTHVPRCVGPTQELVDFAVFCAKALSGIGDIPDTVRDRSVVIRLKRKRADERARRFRYREALEIAEPISAELASWAQDATADLEAARPEIPEALDDRAEEAWEPLLAIALLAGGDWPERAWVAALELSGGKAAADEALGVWLLRDIRDVFKEEGIDRLSSVSLAASLSEIETSPWGDIRGKALDARALARRLKRFEIGPRTVRFHDETTSKGYHLEQFEDAFSRYLGDFERHTVTTRMDKGFEADSQPSHVTDEKSRKPASANGCDDVTANTPVEAERGVRSRPLLGDDGFAQHLLDALGRGLMTEREAEQAFKAHEFVRSRR